jgi:hypothetical protein
MGLQPVSRLLACPVRPRLPRSLACITLAGKRMGRVLETLAPAEQGLGRALKDQPHAV